MDKAVRLEIRLSESMMDDIRRIAPRDQSGKPNISELVRDALEHAIRRNSAEGMVRWAKRNQTDFHAIQDDWEVSAGDGIAAG